MYWSTLYCRFCGSDALARTRISSSDGDGGGQFLDGWTTWPGLYMRHGKVSLSTFEERKDDYELQKYWHDMVMGKKMPQLALIFHNKCWDTFVNYFGPGTMDLKLERIFAICKYIEPPRRNGILESVGWPFEICYNGMGIEDKTQFVREKDLLVFHLTGSRNPHIQKYSLEKFSRRLAKLPSPVRDIERSTAWYLTSSSGLISPRRDIFLRLNFDILVIIASFLSVEDALSLCSVSPATHAAKDMLNSQSFWKSRFRLDGEIGYLNFLLEEEKTLLSSKRINWQKIYHRALSALPGAIQYQKTSDIQHFRLFQDLVRKEKRLWERLWWFHNRYTMIRFPAYKLNSSERSLSRNLQWETAVLASRYFRGRHKLSWRSTRTIILYPSLHQIKVWVLADGPNTHIIGMEFVFRDKDQPNLRLGYHITSKEIVVNIDNPKDIRGLDIRKSREGIAALCFLRSSNTAGESLEPIEPGWIGTPNPDETTRLVSKTEIMALQAVFDVRKVPPIFEAIACSDEMILVLQNDWDWNWEI